MSGNFDGIKRRNFGIEIEMTGLTRCQAAKAAAKTLGGQVSHNGGYYDKYSVSDSKGRSWSFVSDSSIICKNRNGEAASRAYSVELNSPVLEYEDIPLLQEVIRALRRAGGITGSAYKCGTHIHISADDYTPRQLRNLVNIFSSLPVGRIAGLVSPRVVLQENRQRFCGKAEYDRRNKKAVV